MILTCPGCKKSFNMDDMGLDDMAEKVCENCHSRLNVRRTIQVELIKKKDSRPAPSAVETEEVLQPDEKKVLVAVEGSATREMIREVLEGVGFDAIETSTGREALFLLKKSRPAIAILDVGLPQIFGFEVCEIIKKSPVLKGTGVILVASIYDKARYKREPDSLYGADDYIERHHIRDDLFFKIKRLLGIKKRGDIRGAEEKTGIIKEPVGSLESTNISTEEKVGESGGRTIEAAQEVSSTKPLRSKERQRLEIMSQGAVLEEPEIKPEEIEVKPESLPGDPEEHEAARRLARIILSDIALYNQKAVDEGIKNNTFHQILKDDLEEGRRLFGKRVSKEIREAKDYYGEAIEEFIKKRKKST